MFYVHGIIGWWMVGLGMGMILFWALVIGVIIGRVTRFKSHHQQDLVYTQTPLDIARARYLNHEITKEQFDQIKKDLA
jgi:uncharacterized membrane protein